MTTHREVEVTFAPDPAADLPDFGTLDGVQEVRSEAPVELSALYFDTADLRLFRSGVSLRRRTGGSDEGWHVKVPVGAARDEIRRPLGRPATVPPKPLRDLVMGWTHGAPVHPIGTVTTHRSPTLLLGPEGEVLAEFTDDRVTGTRSDGETVRWREWELELVHGEPALLEAAEHQLAGAGVATAEVSRKIARVLGDHLPPSQPLKPPRAGKSVSRLVRARLAEQVEALARQDVEARRGSDEGVHKMRVACRRLRGVLATFRPVLDREQTDRVRDELRWLIGVLATARDSTVVLEQLRRLVGEEPAGLVHGPVLRRLRTTLGGRGRDQLRRALESRRYLALREKLDRLVAEPPWTPFADAAARDVVPTLLRKELKRCRRRARAAAQARSSTATLHDVRKAAKRLRYAAETVEPIDGKAARRLARDARRVTSQLGKVQDTTMTRAELFAIARTAGAAGEPTFTYGRLHAREEARAEKVISAFWAQGALDRLEYSTRKVSAAARR